ncbi:protein RecA [Moorella sp. E308F]|uniref:recombinase RecA n=1 Tax=Moorella sp. E308F TaxID=2572682 RepID=UPI0010FFB73C|nr:DNA recombination/repair protein RecA [Moorella sp. E308F]GEA16804.1 protein RecA [Moorella sp. E308F]
MMDNLNILLASIRKEFGPQAIFLLGENERFTDIKVRSSGSIMLDLALGGGYPHGRLVEFSGPPKSGKTTLLNIAIAEAQQAEPDKYCAVIDLEYAFNPEWAATLGVNLNKLFFSQPDTYAEKVFALIEYLLKTGEFSIIGLDSVAGLIPKSEFEEHDWDKEGRVGGASKVNSMAVRRLVNSGLLAASGTTLIFINQIRDKIGSFSPYGTPTTTVGGHALQHAYTQQLSVSIGQYFTKGSGAAKEYLGQQIAVKINKNKIAPPFRTAILDIYYEHGLDKLMELVNVAKELNVLFGTSWLKFIDPRTGEVFTDKDGNDIKFQGVAKAREALVNDLEQNNGELYMKIYNLVQEIIRG